MNHSQQQPYTHVVELEVEQSKSYRIDLHEITRMPQASGYLWNDQMSLQMNCQGYASVMFMDPEPSKYSTAPNLEAQTFIQPETQYYAHYPGRFFYLKNLATGELISLPFAPCKVMPEVLTFSQQQQRLSWHVNHWGASFDLTVALADKDTLEVWQLDIVNDTEQPLQLSLISYFSVGYRSWMYQSGFYDDDSQALVCKAITPYQRLQDYKPDGQLKDITFCLSEKPPTSWCANQQAFEGDGHISAPQQCNQATLNNDLACYETPVAAMQFKLELAPKSNFSNRWLFGATTSVAELDKIRQAYLENEPSIASCGADIESRFELSGLDADIEAYANCWGSRQIRYLTDTNRLTTDPQTRNLVQDVLGLVYIDPDKAKRQMVMAMQQQRCNGEMPDGILLTDSAELKYINQVPHGDHSVWPLLWCQAYLDETNDVALLNEMLVFSDSSTKQPFWRHLELAIEHLLSQRDERGLSYIQQGDWCDPMNMVGPKGKGVSSWLTMATACALKSWCYIVEHYLEDYSPLKLNECHRLYGQINEAVNQHFWNGSWYARGITDNGRLFGVASEPEGQMYLNPQSWAMLSGAASSAKCFNLLYEVERRLNTPYGTMMLSPAYTSMVEDIGRLTQKYPGVAENGSVYNHASAFYAYALYQVGEHQHAYQALKRMLPKGADALIRGQLPNFIPNYYRGAYYQNPDYAGRSSHLVNTGTCAWVYRMLIEELCGLKGFRGRLVVSPKLPASVNQLSGKRQFAGATFNFTINRSSVQSVSLTMDGLAISGQQISDIQSGRRYQLNIEVPFE
ncbi:GH36-type glycosyl hydrolase domain-containing protein [Paraferrimonas haliotis]|uniref:Cellobionic acid phosphorylase n=1 Tax=Paraferrimonas haliotis TaxID=2013866 RepID=A0AA37TYB3_9GAMM|nr:NdvB protein [Paraferrimonas haliotis]GLS83516.1 cellobionic acid phosphorylase [Paraferrimonas haliotis]